MTAEIPNVTLSNIVLPLSRAAVHKVHNKKALDAETCQAAREEQLAQELLGSVASRMRQLSLVSTQLLKLVLLDEPLQNAPSKIPSGTTVQHYFA